MSPLKVNSAARGSFQVVVQTLTLVAAAGTHAGLEIGRVRAGNAEVQLSLQHPLPHPLALLAGGRAAGGPRRPVGVDARLRSVVCRSTGRRDHVTAAH